MTFHHFPLSAVTGRVSRLFLCLFVAHGNCIQLSATFADDTRSIFRYDPIEGTSEPIARSKLKAGRIYEHFDERLNRRVWSFAMRDGGFWYALGEGSTQEGWRFDLMGTSADLEERAKRRNPQLFELHRRGARPVRYRLVANGKWQKLDATSVLSIYNAETGERWENHSGRYVPVINPYSRYWSVRTGHYAPVAR